MSVTHHVIINIINDVFPMNFPALNKRTKITLDLFNRENELRDYLEQNKCNLSSAKLTSYIHIISSDKGFSSARGNWNVDKRWHVGSTHTVV